MSTPLVVEPRLRRIVAASVDRARAQHASAARSDETQSVFERYALDPLAMLDDGVVFIHSRDYGGRVPLEAFDYQRDALAEWIDLDKLRRERVLEFRSVHVEKTRQMGCSWVFGFGAWWATVFHDAQGLALSMDASDIDDRGKNSTWKSFFGKVRYIDRNAPAWLQERSPLDFTRLLVQSRTRPSSSFIIGEGQTTDPGRGGTFTYAILDEFARVEWADSVLAAVRRACPRGMAMISTPKGTGNAYYATAHPRNRAWRYLRMHWSQHPLYGAGQHVSGEQPATCERCRLTLLGVSVNASGEEVYEPVEGAHRYLGKLVSPWYDDAVEGVPDEEVAAEVDIDYSGSLPARVYREFDSNRHVVNGAVPYDASLPLELAWDYGLDCTSVLICQDHPSEYRLIGELEVSDQTPDQVAAGVRGVLRELGVPEMELSPGWTKILYCVGDPAGEARSLNTGRSLVQDYALQGFSITSRPRRVSATITAVKRLLRDKPKRFVVAGDQCPRFVEHIAANRWPTDVGGTRKPGAALPVDDMHNHALRALAYLVTIKFHPEADDFGDPGPSGEMDDYEARHAGNALGYGMAL